MIWAGKTAEPFSSFDGKTIELCTLLMVSVESLGTGYSFRPSSQGQT